tara:strand:+ start:826 stop:1269 length:444 start_codon:yes stop_codon:yes gene_type:complete
VVLQDFIPKGKFPSSIVTTLERITSPVTDFVRGNPIVSTAAVGIGTTGLLGIAAVGRRAATRKKRKKAKKRTTTRKRKKVRKAPRCCVRRKKKKRKIIRGRGLGRGEIKHSGKGTKGTKLVSFRTKDGKIVRFKTKGSSKRRKGYKK